jgi:hypothetical protein
MLSTSQSSTFDFIFSNFMLADIKKLTISLRLSLVGYETLENIPVDTQLNSTGKRLPVAIRNMRKLRRLHIWVDHDEPCAWSKVNERVIFSPLQSLVDIPNLQIFSNLTKLHPKYRTPERHSTSTTSQTSRCCISLLTSGIFR